MTRIFAILFSTLAFAAVAFAAVADESGEEKPVSEADFRYACVKLCAELDSDEGKAAAKTIVNFSTSYAGAESLISPDTVPWMSAKAAPEHADLLLAAYIAGNTLSQLDSGVKGSDAYSGIIQVFRIYRLLKKKHADFKCKEIDELLAKHKDGKLMSEMAKLSSKAKKK